jgi:hypothetical protein
MGLEDIVAKAGQMLDQAISGSDGSERDFYVALRRGNVGEARKYYSRLSGYSLERANQVVRALGIAVEIQRGY